MIIGKKKKKTFETNMLGQKNNVGLRTSVFHICCRNLSQKDQITSKSNSTGWVSLWKCNNILMSVRTFKQESSEPVSGTGTLT